ncbi:MAG: hypothetical protein ACREOO_07005 [bacterium]
MQKLLAWANSRTGIRILLLLFVMAMTVGMAAFDLGERFERVSMCAFFCAVSYFRDQSAEDRWLAIAIMAGGTLLSLVWSF